MTGAAMKTDLIKNTSYKVVVPFYLYAAVSFLAATILLVISSAAFTQHYFHPHTLAITHAMALGWGTMIILGASHQLVPVLIEGKLYSNTLAYLSFVLAAVGIPLLVYAFYVFNIGWPARWGGILINASILAYLINVAISLLKSKHENVQAVFVVTAICWLLVTTAAGLILVYNFAYPLLSNESLRYLPFHAHLGIIGWFLLMVIGVGSRLIPLFLISKYNNTKLLWWVYALINARAGSVHRIVPILSASIFLFPACCFYCGGDIIICFLCVSILSAANTKTSRWSNENFDALCFNDSSSVDHVDYNHWLDAGHCEQHKIGIDLWIYDLFWLDNCHHPGDDI